MDYLQYIKNTGALGRCISLGFKPCYKWITFNMYGNYGHVCDLYTDGVLNLVINGLPSISTSCKVLNFFFILVLNLVINGLPSISLLKVQMPYLWQKEVIFIWQQKLCIFPYFEDFRDFILIFYYIFFTFLLNSEHFIF